MFGKNEIHGRKTFKGHEDLLVTSVFFTIQGEGPFAGRPAVFLRLTHCSLACSFCDTNFSHGQWMTRQEVCSALQDVVPKEYKGNLILVITGGEPMLQKEALELLLPAVSSNFHSVQIESNGLQLCKLPYSTTLVVSPKCAETNGEPTKYLKPPSLVLDRADYLKFVVTADSTSPYHDIPKWAHDFKRPIYVSPMAEYIRYPELTPLRTGDLQQRSKAERVSFWENGLLDMAKMKANHEYAGELCLKHGFYMSMQMHLFLGLP